MRPAVPSYIAALCFHIAYSELPPSLPGDEVTQEYINWAIPKDTAEKKPSGTVPASVSGIQWLDKAQKSWDAPPIAEQMSAGSGFVPMGKGGIFIPRLSPASNEPDVDVLDLRGRSVASGGTGRTFNLEPGSYFVMIGSGAHNQRMVRTVEVSEGKTVPVTPDWSGLSIETVDSMTVPFRGEYELVRIDEFETYGRGFGANPDLGEVVKTWILKPGVYKILGVGQGYNSLINFVTVRLLPGEMCKLLLVQSRADLRILGGGTVDVRPKKKITSHWKYGADIGGNVKFNSSVDRISSDTLRASLFGLLSTLWLTYQRQPFDWQTRIRLDEGFNLSGFKTNDILSDADDFLFNTLFIWRFFSWLGPYGRAEMRTSFMPRRIKLDETSNYFCILDHKKTIAGPPACFDSSSTYRIKPSLSPLLFDIGMGANADVVSFSFLETKLRLGIGSSYSHFPPQHRVVSSSEAKWNFPQDSVLYSGMLKNSVVLVPEKEASIFELGPQASVSGTVRIARVITADGELKMFAPVVPEERFMRPDFDLRANVSWRLSRGVTLDYSYTYLLKQPEKTVTRIDRSTHGIWLRFSFSSR